MTKTEAAEILANLTLVLARKKGWSGVITNDMLDIVVTEAMTELSYEGGRIRQAALVRPSNRTIRTAGRKSA